MTLAGFIQQVEAMPGDDARTSVHYDSSVTVEELSGSLDGSARPVSYRPQPWGQLPIVSLIKYSSLKGLSLSKDEARLIECTSAPAWRLVSHVGSDQSVSSKRFGAARAWKPWLGKFLVWVGYRRGWQESFGFGWNLAGIRVGRPSKKQNRKDGHICAEAWPKPQRAFQHYL